MTRYKEDEDQFLEQCAKLQMTGYTYRDPEELWQNFEARHLKRRRPRWFVAAVALVALFVFGIGTLVSPEQSNTVGERLVSIALVLTGNTETREDGRDPAPTSTDNGLALLKEIKAMVPFEIKIPTYIAERYVLVDYHYEPPPRWVLSLHYQCDSSLVTFRQRSLDEGSHFTGGMVGDTNDLIVSEVQIGDAVGTFVLSEKDERVWVEWIEDSVAYELFGHISPEEAITSIESITFLE